MSDAHAKLYHFCCSRHHFVSSLYQPIVLKQGGKSLLKEKQFKVSLDCIDD